MKAVKNTEYEVKVKQEPRNLSEIEVDLVEKIVWKVCEDFRHKLSREHERIYPMYTRLRAVNCATEEFQEDVLHIALHLIAFDRIRGKKTNILRVVKKAVKARWIEEFGK